MAKVPMVLRSFRVPLPLWDAALEKTEERNETISDVLRDALETYIGEDA